jgi:hypothetical protein
MDFYIILHQNTNSFEASLVSLYFVLGALPMAEATTKHMKNLQPYVESLLP